MKWLAQSTIYRDSIDLVAVIDYGGERDVAQPMVFTMERQKPHMVIGAPTLELSPDSAKSLMQALWDAGIRPNEAIDSKGEVKALRDHVKFAEGVTGALLGRLRPDTSARDAQ